MKIERIQILNFKSIESLEIRCHRFYTAICGKNNAGKTTIFTALRSIFDQEEYDCDKRAIQQLLMEDEAEKEQVFPNFPKVCAWNEVC